MIAALITEHLGTLLSAIVALAGVLFGAFRHQQARAATAQASAVIAQAKEAQASALAAAEARNAQTAANALAARESAAQVPDAQLDQALKDAGGLRK